MNPLVVAAVSVFKKARLGIEGAFDPPYGVYFGGYEGERKDVMQGMMGEGHGEERKVATVFPIGLSFMCAES